MEKVGNDSIYGRIYLVLNVGGWFSVIEIPNSFTAPLLFEGEIISLKRFIMR